MGKLRLYELWENISRKEKIKIAIDGSSYKYDEDSIQTLSYLNIYEQFDIIYISSEQVEGEKSILKIFCPEYKRGNEITIKATTPRELRGSGFKDGSIKNILSVELIACIALADVVATRTDIFSKVDKNFIQNNFYASKTFVGNLSECLSAIRAWINKHAELTIKKDKFAFHFSKLLIVTLSEHILLPHFDDAWRAAVAIKEDKYPLGEGTLNDYLYAISLRVRHMLTTRDILEVSKLNTYETFNRKSENYSYMLTYYLGYFLILATAILDSLCWVTNWRLGRIIGKGYEISLRKTNKHYGKFIASLSGFNIGLSNYVALDSTQSYLELIYYLRNFIAHNIMPGNINILGNYQGLHGELIVLQGKVENKVMEFSKYNGLSREELMKIGIECMRPTVNRRDDKTVMEPILFARYSILRVMNIIEIFFSDLSMEKKMLSEKEEIEKYDSLIHLPLEKNRGELIEKTDKALIAIEASIP